MSVDCVDVGLDVELGGDSSVHAEVVAIDISCDGEGFKAVDKEFVDSFVELLEDLISEGEVLGHGATFVVSPQHNDAFGVVQL